MLSMFKLQYTKKITQSPEQLAECAHVLRNVWTCFICTLNLNRFSTNIFTRYDGCAQIFEKS